ncbi:E3 ubiquitin-protein ligase RMA3-like [Tripterygium wilfordii]|uniref:E3 ubiquitin-protein ligase RMA3-like n=1 Tax=Tripterygium wilfordii TaxID=458696 RepID=UPI0018F83EC8|nr:E3 ubiquitin-protein ligase RMA3-like [Tripterygium wilfordii]
MAVEQGFFQPEAQFESDGDVSPKQKWDAMNSLKEVSHNIGGCFDCNICLETARNPIVTLCGHLYCWPCINQWLHVQSPSPEADHHREQNCPICKSNISLNTLVPLYGHDASPSESETKKPELGLDVPRPPPPALITSASPAASLGRSQQFSPQFFQTQSFYNHQYFPNPYGGITTTSLLNPTIVMLGELVFERVFGMSNMRLFPYPNSYTSPRMRRQEMQLDKSLSRVSIFFFCCLIICLLLF